MKRIRVNIRTAVNSAEIRRERRDGRDVVVVPSATLPDGIVMNGIRYPAEEIEKSFESLEGTPAPLGHPMLNGSFVSASDPRGMVRGFVGAWNENVRRDGGRVYLDKVIDVAFANQTDGGKSVLNAIEKGEPIHTSTGLICNLEGCEGDQPDGAKKVARNMMFDHDAILLGEDGAATPQQGVGMLVNKAVGDDGQEIEVINSVMEEIDRDLDWAAQSALRALEREATAPLLERIKSAMKSAFRAERDQPLNKMEKDMPITDEQFSKLSETVNALSENIGDQIANAVAAAVKPLTDNLAEVQNAQKARDDAEKAELVNKVVKANILSEEAAKGLANAALKELAGKLTAEKAAPLNAGGFGGGNADEFDGYSLNAALEGSDK